MKQINDQTIYHDPMRLSDYIILAPSLMGRWYYTPAETVLEKARKASDMHYALNMIKFACIGAIAHLFNADLLSSMNVKRMCGILEDILKNDSIDDKAGYLCSFHYYLEAAVYYIHNQELVITNRKNISKKIQDRHVRQRFLQMPKEEAREYLTGMYKSSLSTLITSLGGEKTYRMKVPENYDDICSFVTTKAEREEVLLALDLPIIEHDIALAVLHIRKARFKELLSINAPEFLINNERRLILSARVKAFISDSTNSLSPKDKLNIFGRFQALDKELASDPDKESISFVEAEIEKLCVIADTL